MIKLFIKINIVDSKNFKFQFVDCRLYYNVLILEEEFRGIVVLMVRNWFEYKMLINIDLNEVFFDLQFLVIVLQVLVIDRNKGENGVVDYIIFSFRDNFR